jgi:hypothetical protein
VKPVIWLLEIFNRVGFAITTGAEDLADLVDRGWQGKGALGTSHLIAITSCAAAIYNRAFPF